MGIGCPPVWKGDADNPAYKTGSSDEVPQSLKMLKKAQENPERSVIKKAVRSFQLPLYLYGVQERYKLKDVIAALYNLRTLKFSQFPTAKEYAQRDEIMDSCINLLGFIIDEIFDPKLAFEADDSDGSCKYCPFISLCKWKLQRYR